MSSTFDNTTEHCRRALIFTLTCVLTGILTLGWISTENRFGFILQSQMPIQHPTDMPGVVPGNTTKRVFFNRMPKCGSEMTMAVFRRLAMKHGWHYPQETTLKKLENPRGRVLGAEQFWTDSQDTLSRITALIMSYDTPMLYSMHVHYFNMTRFTSESEPLLINVIRDPLERLVSWYYYIRFAKGHRRTMTTERRNMTFDDCVSSNNPECTAPDPSGFFTLVPYFCGHDDICRYPNPTALRLAQYHVSRHLVVGLLEHYKDFLFVIETLLPSYFKGATAVYKGLQKSPSKGKLNVHNYKKPALSEQTVEKMKQLMDMEYEFYYFVKQRFFFIKDSL